MNKTIKEQAEAYYQEWRNMANSDKPIRAYIEQIITEERKRRLPSIDELGAKLNKWSHDISFRTSDFRDWLLSYESEAVVEDEVKGEDYQSKYNDAMVIIKRQAGDLQLLREKNHKLDSENIELRNEIKHLNSCIAFGKDLKQSEISTPLNEVSQPINRNELAEKIMLSALQMYDNKITDVSIVSNSFSLADEFIKQAKS